MNKKYFIDHNSLTKKAISKINKLGGMNLIVVEKNNKLKGVLSSRDLRKAILNNYILDKKISRIYNRKAKFLYSDQIKNNRIQIENLLERYRVIPVINRSKTIVSILDSENKSILPKKKLEKLPISVVIMAGGKGERLMPYTSVLPKPLLLINKVPTLKHIIDKFNESNIKDFFITLNYKSELIQSYLKNLGSNYFFKLVKEKIPLGTAGSLFFLKNKVKKYLFLTNCDTIINCDYRDVFSFHKQNKNDITIVTAVKKIKIPYGVCGEKNGNFEMKEKPTYSINANTGFYLISSECLKLIKNKKLLDFNQFLTICEKYKKKIGIYKIKEKNWTDTGQLKEHGKN